MLEINPIYLYVLLLILRLLLNSKNQLQNHSSDEENFSRSSDNAILSIYSSLFPDEQSYLHFYAAWSKSTPSRRLFQSCAPEDIVYCSITLRTEAIASSLLGLLGLLALENVSVSLGCK